MTRPFVFAVTGVKNSGKTTLMEKLIRALSARGLRVASIKHDAHAFEPDVPGRDSHRHRAAGAYGSAVFDADKFMVIKNGPRTIEDMLGFFEDADIILLEGARETDYPKAEIVRGGNSSRPISNPASMVALVTDLELCVEGVPTLGLDDVEGVVVRILEAAARDAGGSALRPPPGGG